MYICIILVSIPLYHFLYNNIQSTQSVLATNWTLVYNMRTRDDINTIDILKCIFYMP